MSIINISVKKELYVGDMKDFREKISFKIPTYFVARIWVSG